MHSNAFLQFGVGELPALGEDLRLFSEYDLGEDSTCSGCRCFGSLDPVRSMGAKSVNIEATSRRLLRNYKP